MNQIINKTTFLITILSLLTLNAGETLASPKTGDMFYDEGYIYDRPEVPSDRLRGTDMLPDVPVFWNIKAEMFDHANKINIIGQEDMLRTRSIAQVPVHLLKIDD